MVARRVTSNLVQDEGAAHERTELLSLEEIEQPGLSGLKIGGELDVATAPRLGIRLDELMQAPDGGVLLDLSAVAFMDSTGVSMLLNALTRMTRAGRRLALACPADSPVSLLLARTRLDTTFPTFGGVDEAAAWLLAGGSAERRPIPDGASRSEGAAAPLPSQAAVARQVGVTPATLRRWVRAGAVSAGEGWTSAAIAHAKVVARLRKQGHSLQEIRAATEAGRLAAGPIEDLFPSADAPYSLEEGAMLAGLQPALVGRLWSSMGFSHRFGARLTQGDVDLLGHAGAVLAAGLPTIALLQLTRVYGQALAQLADAEVRLFHLYVHEPLMVGGTAAEEIAEHMHGMARELLPLTSPIMEHMHQRLMQHFIERDLLGHMDVVSPDAALDVGRVWVVIVFADLAGYTRLTEERGEEAAVATVARLTEAIEHTLPRDARIIKTIGDEVMIVGHDPLALTEWAVGFQLVNSTAPRLRIGMHYGQALYREGDYYGRDVNLAARVAARSAAGEILVTRPIADACAGRIAFEGVGHAALKGVAEAAELFRAQQPHEG
jgi:adenylate cyclase